MQDESEPEIILCKRKMKGDGDTPIECGAEVPLTRETLKVLNPKVPTLTAICPDCGYSNALTKDVSAPLAERFFSNEVKAAAGMKSAGAISTVDDDLDDFRPAAKIAKGVTSTLKLFGPYKGAKWDERMRAITDIIMNTPHYQTPQGVYNLLLTFGIDAGHLNIILQRAFSMGTQGTTGQLPDVIGLPGNPQILQQLIPGAPSGIAGSVQQLPGGQVIIVPPTAQPGGASDHHNDDSDVVEEILDKSGNVARRIVRRSSRGGSGSAIEQMAAMVAVMKDLGIVGGPGNQPTVAQDPVISGMLTQMQGLLDVVSGLKNDQDRMRSQDSTKELRDMIVGFEEQIQQLREEKHDNELRTLKDRLAQIESGASVRRLEGAPGEPIEKTKLNLQHDTINKAGDRAELLIMKAIDPLIEMQKTQMKVNALLLIRQVEQQDGVNPGTYTRTLAESSAVNEPSDDEVAAQKSAWQERARRAGSANKGENA